LPAEEKYLSLPHNLGKYQDYEIPEVNLKRFTLEERT